MLRLKQLLALLVLAIASSFASQASWASSTPKLLVLYPQINPSYELIFKEIISGINSHPSINHSVLAIQPTTTADDVLALVKRNDVDAIIALGKQTYDFAHKFSNQVPVIHGGLLINPNGHSGISLVGAPQQFFSRLSSIAPEVKRVFTVYSDDNSGWVIELAREAAEKHGIELKAYSANNIRDAVKQFRVVLKQANDSTDAIWLLLDNILPDKTVMPMALEVAWKRRVVLFSNNPSHTKRGALFALFPDHQQMGYSLADLAVDKLNGDPTQQIVLPLSNLKISLNKRTASHLGLRYSKSLEEDLDIVYPIR